MTDTYQGKPCARGHDGTRYASNRKCVACSRREVRWFELRDDAARVVPQAVVAYASLPGRSYWRAVRVK